MEIIRQFLYDIIKSAVQDVIREQIKPIVKETIVELLKEKNLDDDLERLNNLLTKLEKFSWFRV